jgi:hypothetical protein
VIKVGVAPNNGIDALQADVPVLQLSGNIVDVQHERSATEESGNAGCKVLNVLSQPDVEHDLRLLRGVFDEESHEIGIQTFSARKNRENQRSSRSSVIGTGNDRVECLDRDYRRGRRNSNFSMAPIAGDDKEKRKEPTKHCQSTGKSDDQGRTRLQRYASVLYGRPSLADDE